MSALPPGIKRKPGKKRLPDHQRRVLVSVRVTPVTLEYLRSLGDKNLGRALDGLVSRLSLEHGLPAA